MSRSNRRAPVPIQMRGCRPLPRAEKAVYTEHTPSLEMSTKNVSWKEIDAITSDGVHMCSIKLILGND